MVVQHTGRVHSKLKFLRLHNLHAFDEVGVEIEASRSLDPFPARLHLSRSGIHQKEVAFGIGDRLVGEIAIESVG